MAASLSLPVSRPAGVRPRRSAAVLVVAVLVVLAGCGALLGGGDGGPDVPEGLAPPGVSEAGVEGERLLAAHRAAVAETGLHATRRVGGAGASATVTTTLRVGPTRTRALLDGPSGTTFLGPALAVTRSGDARPTYELARVEDRLASTVRAHATPPWLGAVIQDGSLSVASVNRSARTVTLDVAGGDRRYAGYGNVTGTLTVRPDGLVVAASLEATREGATVRLERTLEPTGTTPAEPDWLYDALVTVGTLEAADAGPVPTLAREFVIDAVGLNVTVAAAGVPADSSVADLRVRPVGTDPDNPLLNATVSSLFTVEVPGDPARVGLRTTYAERLVPPNGTEVEIRLYRLNATSGRFVPLPTVVDADRDVVSATTRGDVSTVVVAMHAPTFRRLVERVSDGTTTASTATTAVRAPDGGATAVVTPAPGRLRAPRPGGRPPAAPARRW